MSNSKASKHPLSDGEDKSGAKQAKRYVTVKDYLEQIALDPSEFDPSTEELLYKVPVVPVSDDGTISDDPNKIRNCYFMAVNKDVKFRHMGQQQMCPPRFYVTTNKQVEEDQNKVFLYFTASGSGKTVELACSSYTREADLALLFNGIHDTTQLEDCQKEYSELCNQQDSQRGQTKLTAEQLKARRKALMNARRQEAALLLTSSLEYFANVRGLLNDINDAVPGKKPKIVLCLDEVYTCPILVRSIIADRKFMAQEFSKSLLKNHGDIEVVFSFAGTGAARASVGSNDDNFIAISPVANRMDVARVIFDQGVKKGLELTFPSGKKLAVTYENVNSHLPFVSTLLENGRMNTIACSAFNRVDAINFKIDEAQLLEKIITLYVYANGLQSLTSTQARMLMGACAMATILFQPDGSDVQNVLPSREWDIEKVHSSGEVVGFQFEDITKQCLPSGVSVVLHLQGRLGLIEPSNEMDWEPGSPIRKPFKMGRSLELVALHLLGIDLTKLLRLDPFGFEVVTTHLIKCALAAACVVRGDQKPTVRDALSKIGFSPHVVERRGKTVTLTSKDVVNRWNDLGSWRPLFHGIAGSDEIIYRQTHFMSVELDVLEIADGDDNVKDHLQIDKIFYDAIRRMRQADHQNRAFAPFASINYGNSPLLDGSVTLFMRNDVSQETTKCTIMNQAKDYDVGASKLDYGQLKEHSVRCRKPILDTIFGSDRLLCLSGRDEVISSEKAQESKYGRPYLPFCVNSSVLLCELLHLLDEKRSKRKRTLENAIIVDENGDEVPFDRDGIIGNAEA